MLYKYVTSTTTQTKQLGELLACHLSGGEIICLSGELGAGKTTFTQGLLKGLQIKGPYTSPTFAILKEYKITTIEKKSETSKGSKKVLFVYHIDAYRISSKDLLELGFNDFAGKKDTITIIEWPEKAKKIIPTKALWINFEWLNEQERTISLSTKKEL